MSLVVDSSVALAWLFDDERAPSTEAVLARVQSSGAWVPAIWRLEVANALQQGIGRGRMDAAFRNKSLADLSRLPVVTDGETDAHAWVSTLELAERFRLTAYDACYLELAQRRELPLATLDGDLRRAAGVLAIELHGT